MKSLEKQGWVLGSEVEQWIWEMVERYGLPEQCDCGIWFSAEKVKVTSHQGRLWSKCASCETMYRIVY